jgi:5-methylcytosine-specific restriction endonuclease McrA/predicted RNA-binding Zn-ribbon protein involved in translation (DUF1610 family)
MPKKTWRSGPQRAASNLICPQCGKEFYRSPANRSRNGGNNYCSRDCMARAFDGRFVGENSPRWKGRVAKTCDSCGKTVERPLWHAKQNEMTFCDYACFGDWKARNWTGEDNPCWRGGHPPYYGANWKRQQREARRRDNHQCKFCGIHESKCRRALDVHHIVPFRLFDSDEIKKANALSNLVSLCDSCHRYAERLSQSGTIRDWATLQAAMSDQPRLDQKEMDDSCCAQQIEDC